MLEVHTLGGLRLLEAGVDAAELGARSAEALLVYLALQPRPVPREVLAELLWPERPGATARANLRSALHRLQRAFGPHLAVSRAAIGLARSVRCDVVEFEACLREHRPGDAVAAYAGPFLAGFYLDGSAGFEAWMAIERERLAGLAVSAFQAWVEEAIDGGRDGDALDRARRLLTLEPLHEPTHRHVLRLLDRLGQRRAALAHYDGFRAHLEEEFGLEPDEATSRLAASLRRGDRASVALEPVDEPTPAGSTGPAPSEVPGSLGTFVGRSAELATIAHRLADPDCRWLTVIGPGGVGKTRLVVEAARNARPRFARGVCFVPLGDVGDPELLLPALAQRLGVDLVARADVAVQLVTYLRDKQLLLVLDELEHLVAAGPRLAEVVRGAPRVKVLASSRTRLHLSEEWLLPLDGFTALEDARALFILHARRADAGFDPRRHEAALHEIGAATGGLPLAIELAATWVNALTPEGIARTVSGDAALLHAPRLDLPPRHRSIARVFDASWDLLPERLQLLFARLGVFRGGFVPEAAAEVAGADLPDLLALTDRSLLRPGPGGRFELHELLRRYARARLEGTGARREVERRHAHAFTGVAERIAQGVRGQETVGSLERFRAERGNLETALAWALEAPAEEDLAVRLIDAMAYGWRLTFALDEAADALRRALALPGLAEGARARLLYHVGHFAWMRGDLEDAAQTLRDVLRAVEAHPAGSMPDQAPVQISLAMTSWSLREPASAIARLDGVIAQLQAEGEETWWLALAHGWRGKAAIASGRLTAARADLDTSLRIFARLGNAWGSGMFLGVAAELHEALGDVDGARRLAATAAVQLERVGFLHALAPICAFLARLTRAAGDEGEAQRHFRRAAEIYREMGDVAAAEAVETHRTPGPVAEGRRGGGR
jgi:DNA-binding SARP family transcriptional activator/predicted ATPase